MADASRKRQCTDPVGCTPEIPCQAGREVEIDLVTGDNPLIILHMPQHDFTLSITAASLADHAISIRDNAFVFIGERTHIVPGPALGINSHMLQWIRDGFRRLLSQKRLRFALFSNQAPGDEQVPSELHLLGEGFVQRRTVVRSGLSLSFVGTQLHFTLGDRATCDQWMQSIVALQANVPVPSN